MSLTLVSALGTGRYEETDYRLDGEASRTRFAPVAVATLVPGVERALLLVTERSEGMWGAEVRSELIGRGISVDVVRIPVGGSPAELHALFDRVRGGLCEADRVVVDITHSFRHLPFVLFGALAFLRGEGRLDIERVLYGAYQPERPEVTPIVDVTFLVDLVDAEHAVRRLLETGDGRAVGRFARHVRARAARSGELGEVLRTIGGAVEGLGKALSRGISLDIGRRARFLLDRLAEVARDPSDPLLARMVPHLRGVAERLATARADADPSLDEEELERELRVAEFFLEADRVEHAMILLREWVLNRALLAAPELPGDWLDYDDVRRPVERRLQAAAERLKEGLVDADAASSKVASLWESVCSLRNRLAHGGFAAEAKRQVPSSERVRRLLEECRALFDLEEPWAALWRRGGRTLLVTAVGMTPGAYFTALRRLRPDGVFLVASEASLPLAEEARRRAGAHALRAAAFTVRDPYLCFDAVGEALGRLRPLLADCPRVVANWTGGSTGMQYLVESCAREAERFGLEVRRVALVDRRSRKQQEDEPFVEGDVIEL